MSLYIYIRTHTERILYFLIGLMAADFFWCFIHFSRKQVNCRTPLKAGGCQIEGLKQGGGELRAASLPLCVCVAVGVV